MLTKLPEVQISIQQLVDLRKQKLLIEWLNQPWAQVNLLPLPQQDHPLLKWQQLKLVQAQLTHLYWDPVHGDCTTAVMCMASVHLDQTGWS